MTKKPEEPEEEMEKQTENTEETEKAVGMNVDEPSESSGQTPLEEVPEEVDPAAGEAEESPEESGDPEAPQPLEPEAQEAEPDSPEAEPDSPEAEPEAQETEPDSPETEAETAGEDDAVDEAAKAQETDGPEPEIQEAPVGETSDAEKARAPRWKASEPAVMPDEKASETKWYVIHAHSGHENKVKQSLDNRVRQEHLEDCIAQVLVPSEEVAEVKGGKKRITSRKIFPGYVLVEMKLSHKTWYLVRTTPGVTGFIGSGKMPTPLDPAEVESIFEQMRGEKKTPKPKVEFEKDERVKIIEGPFSNFMGVVDEVNSERGKLKVMVEIFERMTSVELEFWQVEKI